MLLVFHFHGLKEKIIVMRHNLRRRLFQARFFILFSASLLIAPFAFAVPVYLAPGHLFPSGNYNRDWLKERTREQLIQPWLRVTTRSGKSGWVAAEHVLTRQALKNGLQVYVKETISLRATPVIRSEFIATIRSGELVAVALKPAPLGWIAIVRGRTTGFVPSNAVITAKDIKENSALSLLAQLPVRKQSVPFADAVARVERFEELTTHGTRSEAWGRVSLRSGNSVWWPMNDEFESPGETKPHVLRLLTSQLFQRKLFDMASSPLSRDLKIASADGIFRTTNGRDWTKLVQFRNENHPVAVSKLGRIFIGHYYSDDNGATFSEYIRWDILIARLKQAWKLDGENIRLVEIHPSGREINSVELLLDVGLPNKVTVSTNDLGRNWHARPL